MSVLSKFKNLLFESLKDNKRLIIGLYVLFFICFIVSWVLSGEHIASSISNMNLTQSMPMDNNGVGAFDLFIHNEWSGILTYVYSIIFGIFAVLVLAYNGVNLGMMGQLFNQAIPNGGLKYIVYLIPHGIFEITATVLQSAAGVMLFLFIFRFIKAMINKDTHGWRVAFDKTKDILIQSVVIMIFATILLLIAAPIEAYVSVPFSELIVGS